MNASRENLVIYREIATALRFAHMNHDQRAKQLDSLKEMIFQDRERYEECDYRNTLGALMEIIAFAGQAGTHSEVKSRLRLFETVCNNALSRPHSIFEERLNMSKHADRFNEHLSRLADSDDTPLTDDSDFIPF